MKNKLLIVEDDRDILQLLQVVFDHLDNFEILYAQDGQEALNLAKVINPDVILLDIQLPDSTGYDVCRQIKTSPAMCNTKVLMLSGMTQNSDRLKAQESGADDYITKPFNLDTLLEKVEGLLNGS
jgi:DNA-binding response OmpR family regulator